MSMIVNAIRFAVTGGPAAVMSQIPPETLRELHRAGVDPGLFAGLGGVMGVSAMCCVVGLVVAAMLGAVGGMIMAAVKSD